MKCYFIHQVVPEGYGIGYNVQKEFLGIIFTSYKDKRNASDFVECLKSSFEDIQDILELKNSKWNQISKFEAIHLNKKWSNQIKFIFIFLVLLYS